MSEHTEPAPSTLARRLIQVLLLAAVLIVLGLALVRTPPLHEVPTTAGAEAASSS